MPVTHVYSDYLTLDPDTQIRHMVARKTWATQPWTERGIKDSELQRMWREEGRSFPYLKDVWDLGCKGLADSDIVIFTNTDTCVVTTACALVVTALQDRDAIYTYRIDFGHQFIKPIPDADVHKGSAYAGSDLYGFRVKWWREWRESFPDLLLGIEGWDPCMRVIMEQTHDGADVQVRGIIYHQRHGSFWENPANRYRLGAQKYNINAECGWLTSMGIDPRQFGLHPL